MSTLLRLAEACSDECINDYYEVKFCELFFIPSPFSYSQRQNRIFAYWVCMYLTCVLRPYASL